MIIYLGADHRGYAHKEQLKSHLKDAGFSVEDCGAHALNTDDDYPVFAKCVAEKVAQDPEARGIVLCGSGVGVDIVANKFDGVRAALVENVTAAASSRVDDNANVLALAADFLDEAQTLAIADAWLAAEFSGEARHRRRLSQIEEIEETN